MDFNVQITSALNCSSVFTNIVFEFEALAVLSLALSFSVVPVEVIRVLVVLVLVVVTVALLLLLVDSTTLDLLNKCVSCVPFLSLSRPLLCYIVFGMRLQGTFPRASN